MARKKKITRKELLKRPDEFLTLSTQILNWVKDNYLKVIWLGSGVVLLLILFFGYSAYETRQERRAHEKYFTIQELTDSNQKIKQLEALVKDYPRTKAAFASWVTLGQIYYQKKDFPRAAWAYRSVLNQGKFSPSFKVLILEDLAYAYEEKGDLQQAAKILSELSGEKENLLKEDILLSLARVYQKMGKSQEAKATYQKFLQSFPKSTYVPMVKDLLGRLKG
jgi:predicted negative regulator of RcsB-dependent stress response